MGHRPYSEALRLPSCRMKNHYSDKEMAERARQRNQTEHGWLLRIYLCDCGEYHFARVKVDGKPVPYIG